MQFNPFHHLASIGILLLLFNSGGVAQRVKVESQTTIISIHSQPESVAVYVDTTLRGFTPVRFKVPCQKSTELKFTKDGFLPRIATFYPTQCRDTILVARLYRPAVLSISSQPESAKVQVSGKWVGRTPLVLSDLPPDTLQIVVSRTYYGSWSTRFVPAEGSRTELIARLPMLPATMNVFVSPPDASVFLDDKFISRGSVVDHETGGGPHKINIHDDSTGRSAEMLFTTISGQSVTLRGKLGARSLSRTVLAFLVPGSPQLLDGSLLKGSLMLVGSLALGINAILSHSDYRDRVNQYDRALDSYVKAPTEVEALRRHDDVEARKSDMDTYYTRRTVSLALFAAVYIYSVVDAWVNHLVVDNLEVVPFNELRTDRGSPPFSPTTGVQLRIRL